MSDGQRVGRETRSDGNEKKVCPPTLCSAKLAPAADDGLLLVLVGRSKYCSANFYGWSLFHFTPHLIKGFSCALNLNYVAFLNPNCNFKLRTSNLNKYLYDRSYVRRKFQLGSYFVIWKNCRRSKFLLHIHTFVVPSYKSMNVCNYEVFNFSVKWIVFSLYKYSFLIS